MGNHRRPAASNGQPIDFSPESGSIDAERALRDADSPTYESIGESETTFDLNDAPPYERERWYELREVDVGKRQHIDDDIDEIHWEEQKRAYHRQRDIQRMASFVHLPEGDARLVQALVNQLDSSEDGPQSHFESTVLAAITIVCNIHGFDPRPANPFDSDDNWDHEQKYTQLREVAGVHPKTVKALRKQMDIDDL